MNIVLFYDVTSTNINVSYSKFSRNIVCDNNINIPYFKTYNSGILNMTDNNIEETFELKNFV